MSTVAVSHLLPSIYTVGASIVSKDIGSWDLDIAVKGSESTDDGFLAGCNILASPKQNPSKPAIKFAVAFCLVKSP